jgi:hypothetical protein
VDGLWGDKLIYNDDNSSIPSNGNGAFKNKFHNGFDFLHGIDSWGP